MTVPYPAAGEPAHHIEFTVESSGAAPDESVPPAKKRRLPLFISLGVVVALLLGLGAYAGYRFLFGGVQPAKHLPASLVFYAGIDLKPGLDQQRKAQALVRKFPKLGTKAESAEQIVGDLLKKLEIDDIDAEKDLISWVGVRAGVGFWLHQDQPFVLMAVATKDDKAAADALARISAKAKDGEMAFAVKDGVALIALGDKDAKDALTAAAAEAGKDSFAASGRFTDARDWLGDDHIGMFWCDLARLPEVLKTLGTSAGASTEDLAEMVKVMESSGTKLQGTMAFGVRATDYGIEARYRTFGNNAEAKGLTDAVSKLGAQPAKSDVAALIQLPDLKNNEAIQKELEELSAISKRPAAAPLTAAEQAELEKLMAKDPAKMTEAEEERLTELFMRSGDQGNPFGDVSELFNAISGATLILSGTDLRANPAFQVIAQAATAADAGKLAELGEIAKMADEDVKVTTEGTTVTVTSSGFGAGGESLAGKAEFQTLLADAPGHVQVAIYVNLDGVLTVKERDEIGPLKAVGFVAGHEGGEVTGSIRVLVS